VLDLACVLVAAGRFDGVSCARAIDKDTLLADRPAYFRKIPIFTPWLASARAVAAPNPDAPPVMIAVILLSSFMIVSLKIMA